jgi:cation diffusion facilitator family transporter
VQYDWVSFMSEIGFQPPHARTALSTLEALAQSKLTVAIISCATAVILTSIKLSLGLITGSLGLLADGLQGLMDVIITLSTVIIVIVAARPACAAWTTGRERLEAIAALIEAAILSVIALGIWYMALQKFVLGHHAAQIEPWHLAIVIGAIMADGLRARYVGWVAHKTGSMALEANATHFRSDAIGSVVVLVGLVLANQGWMVADTIATTFLAAILSWTAWRVGQRAIALLLDVSDPRLSVAILSDLQRHPLVRDVPDLRLYRRLVGSDIVARVVLAPNAARDAASIAAELECLVSARDHVQTATIAITIASK